MKPRIYLETSVVSYLVGRLSRDVIVLGNQELTREWWSRRRQEYDVFISEVVIGEVSLGDAELIRRAFERQCRAVGYEPPVICTPQELMER